MATQEEAGKALGVTGKTIQSWTKVPGSPTPKGRGGYDPLELARWRIAYLTDLLRKGPQETGPESEADKADRAEHRLKMEERQARIRLHNYKLDVLEKKNAPIELLIEAFNRTSVAMADILDQFLPLAKRNFPDLSPEVMDLLAKVIADLSNELANAEPDFTDYMEGDQEGDPIGIEPLEETDPHDGGGVA